MENIDRLINAKGAPSEVIQQAARFCLAEMTGDKTPDEMFQELVAATNDRAKLEQLLRTSVPPPGSGRATGRVLRRK